MIFTTGKQLGFLLIATKEQQAKFCMTAIAHETVLRVASGSNSKTAQHWRILHLKSESHCIGRSTIFH